MAGLNVGNSFDVNNSPKKINKTSATRTAFMAAVFSALTACGSDGGSTNPVINTAPSIANPDLTFDVLEGGVIVKTLAEIKTAAGISDLEGDSIISEINFANLDPSISYDSVTETFTFTAPNVVTNTSFNVGMSIKDSQGNYSNQNVTVSFNSIDENDDAPLNVSNIAGAATIPVGLGDSYEVTPTDLDGILSSSFSIVDDLGNEVINESQLTISEVSGVYTITLPAGLLNTTGFFTLKASFTGVDGGEFNNSAEQIVTKNIEVVQDSVATATYTNFVTTTNSIAGDIACEDLDDSNGIPQSCEYAITLDNGSTPAYQAFANPAGGNVSFTGLTDNTAYRVYTRIYSLNKETNSLSYTEESRVYTTEVTNTAPTASNVIFDLAGAGGKVVDFAPLINDDSTADALLTFNVTNNPDGFTIDTSSWPSVTIVAPGGYFGNTIISYTVTDTQSLVSNTATITLNNVSN